MPDRCVAGGCSNIQDKNENISLHKFPSENDRKRRKQWTSFVLAKRAKWLPTKNSCLCSEHFKSSDFDTQFLEIPGTPFSGKRILKRDGVPTIHASNQQLSPQLQYEGESYSRDRSHRQVVRELLRDDSGTKIEEQENGDGDVRMVDIEEFAPIDKDLETCEKSTQTTELQCPGCKSLSDKVKVLERQLRHRLVDELKYKSLLKKYEEEVSKVSKKQQEGPQVEEEEPPHPKLSPTEHEVFPDDTETDSEDEGEEQDDLWEEPPLSKLISPEENDTDTEIEDEGEDEQPKKKYISIGETDNIRNQPKFIVFLSELLKLFKSCPSCKCDDPSVEASVTGTMLEISTHCFYPKCQSPKYTWRSQPNIAGTKMSAGNFLLSFSILTSGASPSKVLQVLRPWEFNA